MTDLLTRITNLARADNEKSLIDIHPEVMDRVHVLTVLHDEQPQPAGGGYSYLRAIADYESHVWVRKAILTIANNLQGLPLKVMRQPERAAGRGVGVYNPASALEIAALSNRGYLTLNEVSAPSSPAAAKLAVYAADGGTPTYLSTKDNAGNVVTLRPMGASGSSHAAGLAPDPGGSAGSAKYLCEDGTWSTPAAGGTDMVRLAEMTASSSASVSFTSGLDSTYRYYIIVLRNVVAATNNVNLLMTMSTNGGSSYLSSNYRYHIGVQVDSQSTYAANNSNADSSIKIANGVSNASGNNVDGQIILYNLTSSSNKKVCGVYASWVDVNGEYRGAAGTGGNSTTSAVNAIAFAMSSGNIASGTFTLYGVK